MTTQRTDTAAPSVDWHSLFFGPGTTLPARLQARAARRFGPGPDAGAAWDYALAEVSANDWARLADHYRGRGSAAGFAAVTFANLMEEYAVRKYGRRRPPAWVTRLGGDWPRIFDLICLRRLLPETVVDMLCADRPRRRPEVVAAIRQVRGRIPDCGSYVGEEGGHEADAVTPAPDESLDAAQWRALGGALAAVFETTRDVSAITLGGRPGVAVELAPRERLLLKLVYEDGFAVARAARALGLHEQSARRLHGRVLARLRDALDELEA